MPHQDRLRITANDLDSEALAWGKISHETYPIEMELIGFQSQVGLKKNQKVTLKMEFNGLTEMRSD